jgi:Na+/H+-dicarboxylate symporter
LVIDQLLDMGRTATNILGNAIATAVIGRNHDKTASLLEETHAGSPHDVRDTEVTEVAKGSRAPERVSMH